MILAIQLQYIVTVKLYVHPSNTLLIYYFLVNINIPVVGSVWLTGTCKFIVTDFRVHQLTVYNYCVGKKRLYIIHVHWVF